MLEFVPFEMIEKLMEKNSSRDKVELVNELISRVIFLPHSEFLKFERVLGASTNRKTPAFYYKGHAFLDVSSANREDASKSIIHEVVHAVCGLNKRHFGKYEDVLPNALELFVEAQRSKTEKARSLRIAKSTYRGSHDSNDYVRAVNRGRKVFIMAQELEEKSRRNATLFFFQDLFRSDVLNDYALDSAARAAIEKHPAQK